MKEWVRSRVFISFSQGVYPRRHALLDMEVDSSLLWTEENRHLPDPPERWFRLGHLNGYSKPERGGSFAFTIEWDRLYSKDQDKLSDPWDLQHPFFKRNQANIEDLINREQPIDGVPSILVKPESSSFEVEVAFNPLRGECYTDAVFRIFLELADRLGVPRKKVWEASMHFDQDAFVRVGGDWMLKREYFEKRIRAKFA